MAMSESQETQLTNLAEIVSEMMKRIDDQELRNKTCQTQNSLEVQALKRRLEDLQNHAIKDAKTIREEYDTAVDSLGNLMEDVARRVTKAVQHYEERFTLDMEKLREHVDKTLKVQSVALVQKIESAVAGVTSHQEADREGESEDATTNGTASTAKMPRNNDIIMRRIESMAHMLRAEALAQSQAFEAKMASMEAAHGADTKRLQGMLQSSYVQLQGMQRSISAVECGLGGAKPQSPRGSLANGTERMASLKVPTREKEEEARPTLREELTTKLRNIQSSVTGVLTALDSSGPTRGQSPSKQHRYTKSPVQLPMAPAGTLEKQMKQKEFESRGPASPLLSTLKEEPRQPQGSSPGAAPTGHQSPQLSTQRGARIPGDERSKIPSSIPAQGPKTRQSQGSAPQLAASMSQQQIPQMMPMPMTRMMSTVYPMHRSGMGSPMAPMGPMLTPQAIPMTGYPASTKVRGI